MIRSDFDKLLDRYLHGQLTPEETRKFEAWLDVRKTPRNTDLVLTDEDEQKLFEKIVSKTTNVEDISAFRPKYYKAQALLGNAVVRIAAGILLLAVCSYIIVSLTGKESSHHEVIATLDIQKVLLSDGTIVWLNKNAHLTYDDVNSVRHVELQGQALFEVAKDAEHPFTISSGDLTATVLGTSFSLLANSGTMQLKVLTGKVNLSSATDVQGVDVLPNEQVVYNGSPAIEKGSLLPADVVAITQTTEYDMKFTNTSMKEVFNRLAKKFDVNISVNDTELYSCRITADFTDHSLSSSLDMLTEILDMEYEIADKKVTVTGKGCN